MKGWRGQVGRAAPVDRPAYWLGVLAGIPISYPDVPYYLLAFAILFICSLTLLVRMTRPLDDTAIWVAAGGILMCAVAILSSLVSPFPELLGPARISTTSFFYLLFICGLAIEDHERFFKGFVDALGVQAMLVILASIFYLPWSMGTLVFSVPHFRLWGAELFPDWPNFFAAMLSMAFIAAITLQRRWVIGLLCLAAAFLTTSRTIFLAVVVLVGWYMLFGQKRYPAIGLAVVIGSLICAFGIAILLATGMFTSEFSARFFLISDRLTILSSSVNLIIEHPLTGVGGVVLDQRVGHLGAASFHNSYLEVAVRTGLLGLAIYLPLIFLPLVLLRWSDTLIPLVLFVLAGSMFQNLLRHPHIAIVFSVLIAWAGLRSRSCLSPVSRKPIAG